MKIGVPYTNPEPWPKQAGRLPDGDVFGYPVHFEPKYRGMAAARGFWPRKRIVVGRLFFWLPARMQVAVLLHEVAHCRGMHLEKRLLLAPLFWTGWVRRWTLRQEHECDEFAVVHGFGVEFVKFLSYAGPRNDVDDPFHPPHEERTARIEARMKELDHALAA
jgi:hypothetical protein